RVLYRQRHDRRSPSPSPQARAHDKVARDRVGPPAQPERAVAEAAPPRLPATRWVYDFSEGSNEMRELLGGKGAGIAEMTRVLGPDRVPAGFTITTAACV